jgi:hypothetical protein
VEIELDTYACTETLLVLGAAAVWRVYNENLQNCTSKFAMPVRSNRETINKFPFLVCLREECKLVIFDSGVFRGIFGPKWDEVTGE